MGESSLIGGTSEVLAKADLCVKCGLCLPHCPTYQRERNEADSPRGRIALVQGLVSGSLAPGARLDAHLDGCLSCRRCELVCPAKVPYSQILDEGRARSRVRRADSDRRLWLLVWVFSSPLTRMLMRGALSVYRGIGMYKWLRRWAILPRTLRRLETYIPVASGPKSVPKNLPLADNGAPPIGVFRGCATDVFERQAIQATERLLAVGGYRLVPLKRQTCCGALCQHAGDREGFLRFARQNLDAFQAVVRIATLTSGCAASLRDYDDLPDIAVQAEIREFCDWLDSAPKRVSFKPMKKRAALHIPCTAANVMKSDTSLRALLSRVPDLEIIEIDPRQACCGAAGTHFMTRGEVADDFLRPKLDRIAEIAPDFVISSNVGCSLHLMSGLTRAVVDSSAPAPVPVVHPAVLLAEQLDWPRHPDATR